MDDRELINEALGAIPCLEGHGYYQRAEAALALADRLEAREGWRDIASAPKDGTRVLLAHASAAFDGWWDDGEGAWVDGETDNDGDYIAYRPSHWMPLPPLPLPPQQERDQ